MSVQPALIVIGPPPGGWFTPMQNRLLLDCTSPSTSAAPATLMTIAPAEPIALARIWEPVNIVKSPTGGTRAELPTVIVIVPGTPTLDPVSLLEISAPGVTPLVPSRIMEPPT